MIPFHIAIDDTDSLEGMCTTFLGAIIFFRLNKEFPNIIFSGFPEIIRLNPNIPFKTKGNGAVAIRGIIDPLKIEWQQKIVIAIFNEFIELQNRDTNPGLVFLLWNIFRR